jgi:hypothetical protein
MCNRVFLHQGAIEEFILNALEPENLATIHWRIEFLFIATDGVRDGVFLLQDTRVRLHPSALPTREELTALWERLKVKHKHLQQFSIDIDGSLQDNGGFLREPILRFVAYTSSGEQEYDESGNTEDANCYKIQDGAEGYYNVDDRSLKILYDVLIDRPLEAALHPGDGNVGAAVEGEPQDEVVNVTGVDEPTD